MPALRWMRLFFGCGVGVNGINFQMNFLMIVLFIVPFSDGKILVS